MKNGIILLGFILSSLVFPFSCTHVEKPEKPKLLLITGGHSFDTTSFFSFFSGLEEFRTDTMSQPAANHFLTSREGKNYDLYIFYDMWQEISQDEKNAYLDLCKLGKPMLFLHHSLVSYQSWSGFQAITGGKYIESAEGADTIFRSAYKHDLLLEVDVIDKEHPITKGMADFSIRDEGYSGLSLGKQIYPILKTSHPDSNPVIAWTNRYENSNIVYLMFGHDRLAYEDSDFKLLVVNSLKWLTNSNSQYKLSYQ